MLDQQDEDLHGNPFYSHGMTGATEPAKTKIEVVSVTEVNEFPRPAWLRRHGTPWGRRGFYTTGKGST